MKNVEIERKWLLSDFPALGEQRRSYMEQGYLAYKPNTVRIRLERTGDETLYRLTVKGKGLLCRPEVETFLDKETYEALRALAAGPMVAKEQRVYALPGGHMLECNLVDPGAPTAFYYAEVEFESEAQANAFVPPGFLGPEKTGDPAFTMATYCRRKQEQSGDRDEG